jgi:hypothetical protein
MTNSEKHRLFLTKAEREETLANIRKRQIEHTERSQLLVRFKVQSKFWAGRDFEHELSLIVDTAAGKDPVWKGHVANNKWFIDKATMYGVAAQVEILTELLAMTALRG